MLILLVILLSLLAGCKKGPDIKKIYLIDTGSSCKVLEVDIDPNIPLVELPTEEQHKLVCVTASDYGRILKFIKRGN